MTAALLRGLVSVRALPSRVLAGTVLASATALAFASMQAWPGWALVTAAIAPWVPAFTLGTQRTYRSDGWLALFYVLVVTQTAHLLEHVAQMTQLHVLDKTGPAARGIFGALDIEWVHFGWNAWVFAVAVLLVRRYRDNGWLWLVVAIATWHIAEHSLMIVEYLKAGKPGHPGFLSSGGILGGGLPVARPDLHFFYNLIETAALATAFVWQLLRSPFARDLAAEAPADAPAPA